MPVSVSKRSGKFRIVDPSGKITKNKAGTAVDGGGHIDRQRAQKQAAAINRNK